MPQQQPPRATPEAYAAMMADPIHRQRLERVMTDLLNDYEWYMQWGSDSQKFQLIRTALPDMLRARRAEEETSKDQQMRDAHMRMREALREHIKVNVPEMVSLEPAA